MKRFQTKGIILSRTDYGEADRIITVLTPEEGKLRLMARGVRKPKSKLAGGIELFSVSDLTFIRGRGEIGTLISSRLETHYDAIVQDIDRVQLGYELIKTLNKATEDEPEPEYFGTLRQALEALNDPAVDAGLIRAWFSAQLLKLAGHAPNLRTTTSGQELQEGETYNFDMEDVFFTPHAKGRFKTDHIKTLRLLFSNHSPIDISKVEGLQLDKLSPLLTAMVSDHLRI